MTEDARRAGRPSGTPRWGWRLLSGTAASLLLHIGALGLVHWLATTPDVGLEFQVPAEVEFGLTEAVDPAAAAPAEPEPEPESSTAGSESEEGASVVDGGAPEPEEDEAQEDEAQEDEAQEEGGEPEQPDPSLDDSGEGFGTEALPPGAQLALRMDMEQVRKSPLAKDIRKLLARIPDWQAVLGGSGLEPVDDLARVLIASPDLRRDRVVVAGRHTADAAMPRDVVARMAEARNEEASWETQHGVPVAPWPDRDTTERVIALIGDQHFTISRSDDLPRVLAVAQARQARQTDDGGTPAPNVDDWGEALLSLEEGEALTLEVEGARHFVRGPMADRFPTRLRLAVSETPTGRVKLTGEGTYGSEEDAEEARDYANGVREAYARNTFVRLSGMSGPLEEAELSVDDELLRFETELTLGQVRMMLGYVEGFLSRGRPPPPPPRAAPSGRGSERDVDDAPPANPYQAP
ncbi:MAG: hypothetical protein ACOCXM_04155 [Myxococcota bacterium]